MEGVRIIRGGGGRILGRLLRSCLCNVSEMCLHPFFGGVCQIGFQYILAPGLKSSSVAFVSAWGFGLGFEFMK